MTILKAASCNLPTRDSVASVDTSGEETPKQSTVRISSHDFVSKEHFNNNICLCISLHAVVDIIPACIRGSL